jgi:hypothetical protein
MSAPRLTGDQKLALLRDYVAGMGLHELANKYGVDRSYPGLYAKRRGKFKPQPKRAPVKTCPACYTINYSGRKTCTGCAERFIP